MKRTVKNITKMMLLISLFICFAASAQTGKGNKAPLIRIKGNCTKSANMTDATVIYLYKGATVNYDYEFDGLKILNTDPELPNIYSLTPNNDSLAVNGVPDTLTDFTIPLSYDIKVEGTYVINAYEISNFDPSVQIKLEDTKENISQDLMIEPIYTFNISPSDKNRFFIHFRNTVTGITTNKLSNELFSVFTNGTRLNVSGKSLSEKGTISIYDVKGRKVMETEMNESSEQYNLDYLKYGVYIVHIESGEKLFVKKIRL